jgi:hypothetical protein
MSEDVSSPANHRLLAAHAGGARDLARRGHVRLDGQDFNNFIDGSVRPTQTPVVAASRIDE